ncbi:MAG: HEAT repeat domain-containing protein [bacterium]
MNESWKRIKAMKQTLNISLILFIQFILIIDSSWCVNYSFLSPPTEMTGSFLQEDFEKKIQSTTIPKALVEPMYKYKKGELVSVTLPNLKTGKPIHLRMCAGDDFIDLERSKDPCRLIIEGYGQIGFIDYTIAGKYLHIDDIQISRSMQVAATGETIINWLVHIAYEKGLKIYISSIRNPSIVSTANRLLTEIDVIDSTDRVDYALRYIQVPIQKVDLLYGIYDISLRSGIYNIKITDNQIVSSTLPAGYKAHINKQGYIEVLYRGKIIKNCEINFSVNYGWKIFAIIGEPNPIFMYKYEDGTIIHYQKGYETRRISPQGKVTYLSNPPQDLWLKNEKQLELSDEEIKDLIVESLKNGTYTAKSHAAQAIEPFLRSRDTALLALMIEMLKDTNIDSSIRQHVAETLGVKGYKKVVRELFNILEDPRADKLTLYYTAYALALAGEDNDNIKGLIFESIETDKGYMFTFLKRFVNENKWVKPINLISQPIKVEFSTDKVLIEQSI